jgi:hypothetical protein
MSRVLLCALALAPVLTGCDSECVDAARLDGTYAMWHSVQNMGDGGTATVSDDYPSYQMFINGWSKWKVKASTSAGTFNADITDVAEFQGDYNDGGATTQAFAGTLTASEKNCNALTVVIEGEFDTSVGTTHAFTYEAEMLFTGEHLAGRFSYADSYTGTDDAGAAVSGALTDAQGELSGTLQVDDFDTGFAD